MSELDYITVKGFKSIASIDKLKLAPMTVLIGPNGSGKSNFIGVFSFLNAVREGRLEEYVIRAGGANKILHFGSRTTEKVHIHISFRNEEDQYRIELGPNASDELITQSEVNYFWDKSHDARPYPSFIESEGREAGISRPVSEGFLSYVKASLDGWRVYQFHDTGVDSPIKKTADVNDNRRLRADASNLAAFLYLLQQRHYESYRLIVRTIRQVAPFFRDFDLEPEALNPNKIRLEWWHEGTDAYFDGSSLSDGTLRFMALATVFLQPDMFRPSVILVDEPELGMHPYAITLLASLMQQVSTEAQVIVATQSTLLLDHFEPEQVLVAERVDGATQFTRLDSSKLEVWLENFSLGQLWEKNEIGGRPVRE